MRKLALTLLAASTVLVLAGCTAAPNTQSAPDTAAPAELPEWLVGPAEEEYSGLVLVSEGIDEAGENLIYSARNNDDEQCIVVAAPPSEDGNGDDWFLSSACGPPVIFKRDGAMLIFGGSGGRSGGAHLLPPGFDKPLETGWTRVSPQLAIKD